MNILEKIVAEKQQELARLPSHEIDPELLLEAIARRGGLRDFSGALRSPRRGAVGLIAEVKKASPSAGIIRADFDPVTIAKTYESAGADCISVLTDEQFFQGSLEHLKAVRDAVSLPLLRKDFTIDARQILEAIECGADAVLLIVAILDDARLRHFESLCAAAGITAIVEVHDEAELDRALAAKARIIGINNRDLRVFKTDLATTERLAARVPRPGPLLISESGIHTHADVVRVSAAGASAVLVGESILRDVDLHKKIKDLMEGS